MRLYDFTARHSRLLQLINEVRARRQARELASALAEAGGEVGLDDRIFSPPTDRVWRTAWDLSERLTDRVRLEAQAAGARFLLVTIPSAIRVDPDPAEREAFMRRLGVDDLAYPEDRLDAFVAERGFEVLHLGPTFVRAAETHQVDLHGFGETLGQGHWNEAGHELAAPTSTPTRSTITCKQPWIRTPFLNPRT